MSKVQLVRGYSYKIRTYQVGSTGKLSLHHLFNLFQDVAHRDALSFGFAYPQMLEHNSLWVLARISVEIDQVPSYDDEVEINTWVKSVSGPKSEREFTLVYNNAIVVRASSLWFCISAEDHRPVRIPVQEKLQELIYDEYAGPEGALKVDFKVDETFSQEISKYRTKHSDVDMVKHVNNAAYVRWVMDVIRSTFPNEVIGSFSINYLNEVHLGEVLEVRQFNNDSGKVYHDIVHVDSGQVACKTVTVWQKA